ncbi:MAG: Ldh family oxidoreductase [Acidobacteriota bacterium]
MKGEPIFIRHGRLHYFVREIFKRLRVPRTDASHVADVLVAADLAGVEGEGVARVPFFADRLSSELINPTPNIKIEELHRASSVATVDGDNGLGPVVAAKAMELALRKAKRAGVGAVAARRSNDFGMAGYYARMAFPERMIGVALSNAPPMVVPVYGTRAMYGVNPIAVAIPAAEGQSPFVLDMTTSATSKVRLEEACRNKETIPRGWALDASGQPTTDAETALKALRLLPLGSRPETGAHKGYGLGLAVDILCGVLSGGSFGLELSGAEGFKPAVAKIGHFFLAICADAFGPWVDFRNRINSMLRKIAASAAPGGPHVYYPGEPEYEIEQDRRANGIPLPPHVSTRLEGLARSLDIRDAWEHLLEGRK